MEGLGRFSEPVVLILTSLAESAKHGYAIQEDIEALSGVRPGPGTLYGAIRRLEERGYIEALAEQDRRKPYHITPTGREALRSELTQMRALAATGLRRLAASA